MKRSPVQRHSLLGSLGLTVAAVLLCLLTGEIAGRLFSPTASLWRYPNYIALVILPDNEHESQMRYDPELGHEPLPRFAGLLKGQRISFNANGLRNHNRSALMPPAGPSVLMVGDSLTEGYMVGDDQTWPANLERPTGRRVFNGGVRAYGIDQMVLRAERLAPRLKPAAMVLAFILDDIERSELSIRDNIHKPYFVLTGDGLALRNVPVPRSPTYGQLNLTRRILGHSYLADFIMRRLGLDELWYGSYTRAHCDGDAVSCRLMARFARLADGLGARALVVALHEDPPWTSTAVAAAERKRTHGVLDCAARAGMATLDTWDGFAAADTAHAMAETYINDHFTDRGNALAAKLVAAALETAPK